MWVFFGLTQPILYLVLFGPLLTNVDGGGLGGENSWHVFVPGLLLQLAIFGAGFAGFGIIQELREGVIDRQRVTPAHRVSLIMGRTLSQRRHHRRAGRAAGRWWPSRSACEPSWGGVAVSIVIVCVLSIGIAAASYSMGLIMQDEDSFAPFVQGVTLPLLLLSGVLLPMTLAPDVAAASCPRSTRSRYVSTACAPCSSATSRASPRRARWRPSPCRSCSAGGQPAGSAATVPETA